MARLSFILLLLVGAGLITSCGKKPIVIPISQLTNSTPFQARVESSYFAYQDSNGNPVAIATLTTTDGRRVSVVGSNASMEQIRFVKSLKKGTTYTFPDVFLEPWRTNRSLKKAKKV